jgi:putative peptidoglycan lipid II flippase
VSRLLRSNITVAAGTSLSRLTGLLRVIALGYVLGQTALADAYSLANETPNIVYELLLGGVLSATLVPLFSTFDEDGDDESTNVVLTVSVILMSALTVLAVVGAPLIFRIY